MIATPYDLAMRYAGEIKEIPGAEDHPLIQWWLSLCGFGMNAADAVPWCSAFVNGVAWECRLPRSKSAMARSWMNVGTPLWLPAAQVGSDVVILERGAAPAGHVGFYAGRVPDTGDVLVLGGNQSDAISILNFPADRVLGVRRLG